MYLPQRKEVEAIVQQNKTLIIACLLLLLVALTGGWMVYRHYDRQAASDNHDVSRTVQSIKDDNQSARKQHDNASDEIAQPRRHEQINDMTKKEARLKRQRDTWAVTAGIIFGWLIK